MITPMTESQARLCRAFYAGSHIVASGSAGTGKSYLALALALEQLKKPKSRTKRIVIVRSAVPTRAVGFLPGTLDEKMSVYEAPYVAICQELGANYTDLKKSGQIEFLPTSYIRSVTWRSAIVIADECQNCTFHELNSIATRLGESCRAIFIGDTAQVDLREQSGFALFLRIAESMSEFSITNFTRDDIVRSSFVKNWIIACEDLLNENRSA